MEGFVFSGIHDTSYSDFQSSRTCQALKRWNSWSTQHHFLHAYCSCSNIHKVISQTYDLEYKQLMYY